MKKLFLLSSLIAFSTCLYAQSAPFTVSLWEDGAPGFEDRKDEPEQAKDWWVKNIHNPSATVFLPDSGKATGAAVVIFPGGGHRELVFDEEGTKAAKYLNSLGIAGVAVKYRLAREEGSPYKLETHTAQDAHRAVRLVRAHAAEWGIDPDKIGVMGFSAGGETAALVAYGEGQGHTTINDEIDRISSAPDFQILIYPGPLFIPDTIPAKVPTAFALVSNNDACCSEPVIKLLNAYRKAGASIEAHVYAFGDHGFNMGDRSELASISRWTGRLTDWLKDSGYAKKN